MSADTSTRLRRWLVLVLAFALAVGVAPAIGAKAHAATTTGAATQTGSIVYNGSLDSYAPLRAKLAQRGFSVDNLTIANSAGKWAAATATTVAGNEQLQLFALSDAGGDIAAMAPTLLATGAVVPAGASNAVVMQDAAGNSLGTTALSATAPVDCNCALGYSAASTLASVVCALPNVGLGTCAALSFAAGAAASLFCAKCTSTIGGSYSPPPNSPGMTINPAGQVAVPLQTLVWNVCYDTARYGTYPDNVSAFFIQTNAPWTQVVTQGPDAGTGCGAIGLTLAFDARPITYSVTGGVWIFPCCTNAVTASTTFSVLVDLAH